MQSPNVLADVTPPPRSTPQGRPDDSRSADRAEDKRSSNDSFREMQSRARERAAQEAAKADRSVAAAEPGSRATQGLDALLGALDMESLPDDLDLNALAASIGLSEGQLEGLLSGELSVEQLLAQADGPQADRLLEGLNSLAEALLGDDAELMPVSLNGGLTENVLAQSRNAAEPALTSQLANMNAGSGGKNPGKAELAQALQALASGVNDDSADTDESPVRRVMAAGQPAELTKESADSQSQPRSGDSLTLQQSANGLRLAEAREPAGTLRHYTTSLETSLNEQDEWHEKMAAKLSWLTNQGLQSAEIHINPADLGPIEVRIQVQNDQATVTVQSQHASVRDMLEQNSSRLRDMLEEQGLDLASFDVSEQNAGQSGREEPNPGAMVGNGREDNGPGVVLQGETVHTGDIHLNWSEGIDLYA